MKTGILFGKGPSFDPGLVDALRPDEVVCVNDSVLHVTGSRWAVWCERAVAERLAGNLDTYTRVYCPERDKDLYPRGWHWEPIFRYNDWEDVGRLHATCDNLCYQEGFSSTNGLWLLWLLGCEVVILSGIGDPGGYHADFAGHPHTDNQGEKAIAVLQKVAKAKGIKLIKCATV